LEAGVLPPLEYGFVWKFGTSKFAASSAFSNFQTIPSEQFG
jgi:hypothetical protein